MTYEFQLMIVAQSGDSYDQLDIEVRVIDLDDNPIEVIDKELLFRIREDEKPGGIFTNRLLSNILYEN